MERHIPVPFAGEGSGVEELTWGQHHIWLEMQAAGSSLTMCATRPLGAGATVEEIVEELRFYMSRYESMRTRLLLADGGVPRQVVFAAGEIPLELLEAGDTDPAAAAERMYVRYRDTIFDYVNEWPVRMGVVLQRGVPRYMVMALCHLVSDAAGAMVMFNDHQNRDPSTGQAQRPAAIQPRELARRQRSPEVRRHSDISLRYWEEAIRAIPARRFVEPEEVPETRYWQAWFTSSAMALGLQVAVDRLRADTSSLLLAAFATALVDVSGRDPAVMRLVVSNRFRPGFAEIVAPVSQFGLCVVEVAGLSYAEVVRRARRRALNANKHAYYDMGGLADLLHRVGLERGEEIDLAVYFNDRRAQAPPTSEVATDAAIRAALERTTLAWEPQSRSSGPHLMLHVDDADQAVVMFAEVDSHHVRLDQVESILRSMETVIVDAATGAGRAVIGTAGA